MNFHLGKRVARTAFHLKPDLVALPRCLHVTRVIANKEATPDRRTVFHNKLLNGPHLRHFFKDENLSPNWDYSSTTDVVPYIDPNILLGRGRKVFFEVYGCQMNVNDTEVIWSILKEYDYRKTNDINEADVIFLVTCAIRDSAEEKIWNKLFWLRGLKKKRSQSKPELKVGVVGCMAERLKEAVLEKEAIVDMVIGPDAYRDLPKLLVITESGHRSINVMLSYDETYADIMPVRLNEDSKTAFVSIMRGCDNMCTYCIVPWTRGRERSRPIASILKEVEGLVERGVKEITLLGQNVNSYRDLSESNELSLIPAPTQLTKGFKTVYKPKLGGLRFSHLLDKVAQIDPEVRIRFTSPHPKDFPDEFLEVIREHPNICKNLHLPAQSGSTAVLDRMRRGYTREAYLDLIQHVRDILPNVGISSDFICGFCGETDEEFEDTLSLIEIVNYNMAYLFKYSMREKTAAHRRYKDDVPADTKQKRLEAMIKLFRGSVERKNHAQVGQVQLVLVEGGGRKKNNSNLVGRNDQNIKVVIPGLDLVPTREDAGESRLLKPGDYVAVHINDANSQILKGIPLYRTTLRDFSIHTGDSGDPLRSFNAY